MNALNKTSPLMAMGLGAQSLLTPLVLVKFCHKKFLAWLWGTLDAMPLNSTIAIEHDTDARRQGSTYFGYHKEHVCSLFVPLIAFTTLTQKTTKYGMDGP